MRGSTVYLYVCAYLSCIMHYFTPTSVLKDTAVYMQLEGVSELKPYYIKGGTLTTTFG